MPTLTLVSGPPGSGKTQRLVEAVAAAAGEAPFTPALVLVPTHRHADQFRRHLAQRAGALFDLTVTTIPNLAASVLRDAGGDVLPPQVALALLDRTASRLARDPGPAAYVAPIAGTPGLTRLLHEAIRDLLASEAEPGAFTAAAQATHDPQLDAIAAIYTAFVGEVRSHGWVHPSAAPSSAAALPDRLPAPRILAVDGFRTVSPAELAFIAALASRAGGTWLACEPGLAHTFEARFPTAHRIDLEPQPAAVETSIGASHDLESEVRAAARHIKQLLTDDPALRPSGIALAARQAAPRLRLVRQVFAEFDLPLDPAAAEPLASRPLGAWLRRLLSLDPAALRLRDLVPLLRSGFTHRQPWQLSRSQLALAAGQARRNRLWASDSLGAEVAAALRRAFEDTSPTTRARAEDAGAAFERAAEALAGIARTSPMTPGEHAARLHRLLFGAAPLIPPWLAAEPTARADLAALQSLLLSLQSLDEYLPAEPVPFPAFAARLLALAADAPVVLREAGGVLFAPLHTLHGLRVEHLIVVGLSEGEFPAPQAGSSLLDTTRRDLLAAAGLPLPPPSRASEDELWESARTRPSRTLTAWRTHLDDHGRPRPASVYYAALEREGATRLSPSPAPAAAASRRELELASVRAWPSPGPFPRPASPAWPAIRSAASIERVRRSFTPAGVSEGDLSAAPPETGLLTATWSASRFESYQVCSFQFFGQYVARLRELDEEAREADAATLGTVVHDILEAIVTPLVETGQPVSHAALPGLLSRLESEGTRIWDEAPAHYGFGRAGIWRLRRPRVFAELRALLAAEADFAAERSLIRVLGVEREVTATLPLIPPLLFSGHADRIDEGPDGLRVITDYKTGSAIPQEKVRTGEKLQLQLYAHAARETPGTRVIARYAPLRHWTRNPWYVDSARDPFVDDALVIAQGVIDHVRDGHFAVHPRPATCPPYCAFIRACRVNEFSRWKWSHD